MTSCESYRGARNPADLVAGLAACVESLLRLDDSVLPADRRKYYEGYLKRLPDLEFGEVKGDRILKPAEEWLFYRPCEAPQFYPLFPFDRFKLGDPEIDVFRNTWKHGEFPKGDVISWHQDGIFHARMGKTGEAATYNVRKLRNSNLRYPTFWGPGHDWTPDHNWGGSGMIGLQEMILQTLDDEIHLVPAWPENWNATFRLHAPGKTVVTGRVMDGKLVEIDVEPAARRKDVIIPEGFRD